MATVFVNARRRATCARVSLRVITGSIEFASRGNADMVKITDEVAEAVRQTGLSDGTVTLFVPGATGALTTLEYEPGVVARRAGAARRRRAGRTASTSTT